MEGLWLRERSTFRERPEFTESPHKGYLSIRILEFKDIVDTNGRLLMGSNGTLKRKDRIQGNTRIQGDTIIRGESRFKIIYKVEYCKKQHN